ncbi:MAG: P1 family peptidase [Christensenellales bacterium]
MYEGRLTDVKGLLVGHAQNPKAMTGCTVILCKDGATGGVDVRGGAPGTRETDCLRPGMLVEKAHGIVLSGGSAFGLDAAGGVMQYLEEAGCGFDTGICRVPIVASAVLFDLGIGSSKIRPDKQMGYEACLHAAVDFSQGVIGAGTGATAGKALGPQYAMKSGLGTASVMLPGGVIVSALVAVNALGDILDYKTGEVILGARENGIFLHSLDRMLRGDTVKAFPGSNTTIGVVAVNAKLDKSTANRLASVAHDGYAMAISPVHTSFDGDTVFALATGEIEADSSIFFAAAPVVVARAIANAAYAAAGMAI